MNNEAHPEAQVSQDDMDAVARLKDAHASIRRELAKVIVGHDEVIEQLLIAIFSQGHCLLEGVPGLLGAHRDVRGRDLLEADAHVTNGRSLGVDADVEAVAWTFLVYLLLFLSPGDPILMLVPTTD